MRNLLEYKNNWGGFSPFLATDNRYFRVFLEPNNGGGAAGAPAGGTGTAGNGAAGGNATSQNSGDQQQQQQQQQSPWDNIPWDELDPTVRRVMEAARTDHQNLATQNATLLQQQEAAQRERQQRDQQQQQQQQQQRQQNQPDPVEANIRASLKEQGYTQQQIDAQAPALAKVMGGLLPLFKQSVGADLQPLATSVIHHENTGNFEAATQTPAGQQLFADPELAQAVWNVVTQQTAAGRTFDVDAILNFAKMQYFDRQQAAGQPQPESGVLPTSSSYFPTVRATPPPTNMNRSTGYNFPGANVRPLTNGVNTNPNGPKHAVNADTQAALATTFAELERTTGVAPTAYKKAPLPGRR